MSRAPHFRQHCEGEGRFCRASKSLQRKTIEVRLCCLAGSLFSRVVFTWAVHFAIEGLEAAVLHCLFFTFPCSRYSLGMGLNYQQLLKNVPMGAGGTKTSCGEFLYVKVNICEPVWFSGGMGAMGLFLSWPLVELWLTSDQIITVALVRKQNRAYRWHRQRWSRWLLHPRWELHHSAVSLVGLGAAALAGSNTVACIHWGFCFECAWIRIECALNTVIWMCLAGASRVKSLCLCIFEAAPRWWKAEWPTPQECQSLSKTCEPQTSQTSPS